MLQEAVTICDTHQIDPIQPKPEFPLSKEETRLGLEGITGLRRELGSAIPMTSEVVQYRPPRDWFADENAAQNLDNPHNEAHIARVGILSMLFVRTRMMQTPGLFMWEKPVLEAVKIHDVRLKGWSNVETHAQEAVDFMEKNGKNRMYEPYEWIVIKYLVGHHSERTNPPENELVDAFQEMLHTLQDCDASDLMRSQLDNPISANDILLRTKEAREYHLPYVAKLIEVVSRYFNSGDIYTDQLAAAQYLGLLI